VKPVRLEPEAKEELAAAAAWYEGRRQGIGLELVVEVDAMFAAIARSPSRFPLYPRVAPELGVRRAAARRFPYSIAFIELATASFASSLSHMKGGVPATGLGASGGAKNKPCSISPRDGQVSPATRSTTSTRVPLGPPSGRRPTVGPHVVRATRWCRSSQAHTGDGERWFTWG
jgi:toxin ParE1/3/4